MLDKFREECAVFGVFGHEEASTLTQLGLFALLHRRKRAELFQMTGRICIKFAELGWLRIILEKKPCAGFLAKARLGIRDVHQPGILLFAKRNRFP